VTLAVVLVATGVWLGSSWAQSRSAFEGMGPWMMDDSYGRSYAGAMPHGMMDYGRADRPFDSAQDRPCGEGQPGYGSMGPGMMDGDWDDMPCDKAYTEPDSSAVASLETAQKAVESYVARLGYGDELHVTEIMEFERNYYAIVAEEETGVGAMELLVDRDSGAVGPEPGPNMMWNAKYGMHRRGSMMGGYDTDEMTLSPKEAQDVAQRWLDTNLPGRTTGQADPFYSYYTLHFLNDSQIEGMLSVHGSTGDVWYHSWHGDFVAMAEGHGHE
jgi:hypothetical protein